MVLRGFCWLEACLCLIDGVDEICDLMGRVVDFVSWMKFWMLNGKLWNKMILIEKGVNF